MHPVCGASFVHTSDRPLRATPQWPALPAGWTLDRIFGIVGDSRDRIYIAHRRDHSRRQFHAEGTREVEDHAWITRLCRHLTSPVFRVDGDSSLNSVPELDHAAPAYGLITHCDNWRDAMDVTHDLPTLGATAGRSA